MFYCTFNPWLQMHDDESTNNNKCNTCRYCQLEKTNKYTALNKSHAPLALYFALRWCNTLIVSLIYDQLKNSGHTHDKISKSRKIQPCTESETFKRVRD